MSDPAEKCVHCGARFDAHLPVANGGFDCPPRADGKVLRVTGGVTVGAYWPGDDDRYYETREWVYPEPRDALEVLQIANEKKP